ncbi:glycosyltransferase [uncultured Cloacibacillus sp.]|uniref:glycosyltransferase family 2 protein n=1 Tax=uncultured Cloacibacillus sp. TaxID=889794 RepID=UPI0027D95F22|nr:glycosyltransferase [uncultured Cloacibacillus sp.]
MMEITYRKSEICAGIVLYNPKEGRLRENINAILPQVSFLFLVDNASSNINKIEKIWSDYSNIQIIKNNENMGIAKALNQMCEAALSNNYKWILTLDQDSVCPDNLIESFIPYTSKFNIGIICPQFRLNLRNYLHNNINYNKNFEYIKYCITSASLTNITAWKDSGGFDEWMFIDCVDYDFCIKLRLAEYKIIRVNSLTINHEVGSADAVTLFGETKVILYNHNAIRNYYMVRNTIYLIRKYYFVFDVYIWIPRLLYWELCKLIFEKNKKATLMSMIKGLRDGFCSRNDA